MSDFNRDNLDQVEPEQSSIELAGQWLEDIEQALKREKPWRDNARTTMRRYVLEGKDGKTENAGRFNILWSNTETLRQALYNQPPTPDVRQRWEEKDAVALAVAELLDRGLTYQIDRCEFDVAARRVVLDYLLVGRGVERVRYLPELDDEQQKLVERLVFENVYWEDFTHSDCRTWESVEWVAFRHRVGKDDARELFPAFDAEKLQYTFNPATGEEDEYREFVGENDDKARTLKAILWEVWDRKKGRVLWVSKECEEVVVSLPPPLDLEGFFPVPRPLLAVERPDSLLPMPLYMQYQEQAAELDTVSSRISALVRAVKWRGLYDASLGESIERVFTEGGDGELVPTDSAAIIRDVGGLEKAIFLMPVADLVGIIRNLYESREQTKQVIYEITGISDILRGQSNPNETATAQNIKSQWGTSRVDGLKRDVQRFFGDMCRISAEIMAETFQRETWEAMTSKKYPEEAEKQQAQQFMQQAQAMQQQGGQPGQEGQEGQVPGQEQIQGMMQKAQALLRLPAWEELERVMRSDSLRAFKVDIETDSTIAPNQQADMQALSESMGMLGGLIQSLVGAVQGGALSSKASKRVLEAVIRKLPLQNDLLPILDDEEEQDPMRGQLEQAQQEIEQLKGQLKGKEQETKIKGQELQLRAQELQGEQQIKQAELQLKARELEQRAMGVAYGQAL